MITGFPTIQGAMEAIKHGALDYLVKPFRLDDLEVAVQRALEHQEQRTRAAAAEPGNGRRHRHGAVKNGLGESKRT